MDVPKRRRRLRFRFSLASLLIFMAVIGAFLAVLRQVLRHANQAEVLAKIMSLNGSGPDDVYDVARVNDHVADFIDSPEDRLSWGGIGIQTASGWPKAVADSIGLDYTIDVTFVSVNGNYGNARQRLELAKQLPRLEHLTFAVCKNADEYIDQLTEFSQVQTVELLHTNVSPAGVAKLRNALPNAQLIVKHSYADYFARSSTRAGKQRNRAARPPKRAGLLTTERGPSLTRS